jgi:branched-chain amino acid transport system ATP-binding protein
MRQQDAPGAGLEVTGLTAAYDKLEVLHGVDVSVAPAELVAVIGSNGAGKTTLLRAIMGVLKPRSGNIAFEGADITRAPASGRLALGFGYMPEDRRLIPDLSVEDNVLMPLTSLGARNPERLEWIYSLMPEVKDLRSRLPTLLSGGQQKFVALARALMAGTQVLLLDEPTEGVAPLVQVRIGKVLRDISGSGALILIAESNSAYLSGIAERLYLIERGKLSPA